VAKDFIGRSESTKQKAGHRVKPGVSRVWRRGHVPKLPITLSRIPALFGREEGFDNPSRSRYSVRRPFMGTELACFLFGVLLTAFWLFAVKKGVLPGERVTFFVFFGKTGLINRSVNPVRFWLSAAYLGVFAFGPLIMPVLSCLGLRK
jgi:hypothetical protein